MHNLHWIALVMTTMVILNIRIQISDRLPVVKMYFNTIAMSLEETYLGFPESVWCSLFQGPKSEIEKQITN